LVPDVVEKTVKEYRISRGEAERIVHDSFVANRQLKDVALRQDSADKLRRTRVFKEAVTEAKRRVYYRLRAYKSDDMELAGWVASLQAMSLETPFAERERVRISILNGHASTRERLDNEREFYQRLFAAVEPPRFVLDVGCGVHPLMFPFAAPGARSVERYVAVDNDARVIECVEAYSHLRGDGKIIAFPWSIADGWEYLLERAGRTEFDLALLMKVVPVVHRQQRELLSLLSETPAHAWLLTGSSVSMTKKTSIERREKGVLREFLKLTNREIKHQFSVGEEFAWMVL
jgi:16S rRNA (guanine(1405)-N(7))-methyltransferase